MKNLLVLSLALAFWFEGNTLYWAEVGNIFVRSPNYFLQLQLDKNFNPEKGIHPTINQEPIKSITVSEGEVMIDTKSNIWLLYYTQDPHGKDWSVTGPLKR